MGYCEKDGKDYQFHVTREEFAEIKEKDVRGGAYDSETNVIHYILFFEINTYKKK